MPNTRAKLDQSFICRAAQWPTIRDLADEYGLPERFVRSAVERRKVEAIKLDVLRINPESWAQFLERSFRPAEHVVTPL